MQLQGSFSQAEYAGKKKQTRRDKFLAEMEQVVPWARLVERLRPLYPKGERGRPPIGLERMLRIHFLQQWYGLADGAMEDALYDSQALRGFAGIDLTVAGVPEETTILNFRHWLEQHELSQALFAEVSAMLEERGLLMRQGTIVDATIIAAPPSTKNKSKARDPEMHQTKKGNQWHFGMKAHIGVDVASGVVHTVVGTAANEADINQMAAVLHGAEEDVFADAGYTGADKRPEHEDRDVSLEHRDQAQHHQSIAERPAGFGRAGRASAGAGAGLGRAPLPHRQEPVPPQEAALSRPGQEHRAAAHPVRPGQPGDRQENPACPIPGLITPGLCLNPGNNTGKPRYSPGFRQHRPLPGTPRSTIMPRSLTRRRRPHCSVFPL